MVAGKTIRLSKLAREFNVGIHTIVEFLHKKGFEIDSNPNTKVAADAVQLLEQEYKIDISIKKESEKISLKSQRPKKEVISMEPGETEESVEKEAPVEKPAAEVKVKEEKKVEPAEVKIPDQPKEKVKVLGKIDLDKVNKPKKKEEPPVEEIKKEKEPEPVKKEIEEKPVVEEKPKKIEKTPPPVVAEEVVEKVVETEVPKVEEVKVVGKIDLTNINQRTRPAKKTKEEKEKERKERMRQRAAERHAKGEKGKSESSKKDDKVIKAKVNKLSGPTVLGKIDLPDKKESSSDQNSSRKKRRKRIPKDSGKVSVDRSQQHGDRPKGKFQVNKQGGKKKRPLKKRG